MGAFRELDLDGKAARLNEAGGRRTYRFRARDVHLVMGPADPGGPVRFRVRIDETRREPRARSTSVIAAGNSFGSAPLPTRPPVVNDSIARGGGSLGRTRGCAAFAEAHGPQAPFDWSRAFVEPRSLRNSPATAAEHS